MMVEKRTGWNDAGRGLDDIEEQEREWMGEQSGMRKLSTCIGREGVYGSWKDTCLIPTLLFGRRQVSLREGKERRFCFDTIFFMCYRDSGDFYDRGSDKKNILQYKYPRVLFTESRKFEALQRASNQHGNTLVTRLRITEYTYIEGAKHLSFDTLC